MDIAVDDIKPSYLSSYDDSEFKTDRKVKLEKAIERAGLKYFTGGKLSQATGAATISLASLIKERNLDAVNFEFDRALRHVSESPREAVSAACNIVESICKIYIEENNLEMPHKQDLQSVWKIVRVDLGFDPSKIGDRDVQEILTGIIAVVNGIGAFRTHESSAHGAGKTSYNLKPRHARLAIHSAHTIAAFIFETWEDKKRAG